MDRSRWFALAAIVSLLAAGVYLALNRPEPGSFIPCIFNMATGLYCPGCGGTRAAHLALNGDLVGALRQNALVVLALPLLVGCLFLGARYVATGKWSSVNLGGRKAAIGALVVLIAFGVLRNLPWFEFLAPTPIGPFDELVR